MLVAARQQRRVEDAKEAIRQLGQYTLEEKIGSGGMGSVYRARHAFLRRPTAVKMLNADDVSADSLARFEREVQLTSQLCHPNTIAVYDYGKTADGTFFYAMEYLEGIDLEDLVQQGGPLPEGRVVPILRQICGSLAEAHAVGLIHRDIKPANVFLTCRAGLPDFVKVLDFGLVKAVSADRAAKLTQANVTVGTPQYLSPEAVEHPENITPQADVYAIGAVAYFLVTGTTVFGGNSVWDICMKQARAIPDPPSARLGRPMSAGLESLILRCLAKKPEDRPPGAQALAEELEHLGPLQGWTSADANTWWACFKKAPVDTTDTGFSEAETAVRSVTGPGGTGA
jgi:serine/threonine protein kinase